MPKTETAISSTLKLEEPRNLGSILVVATLSEEAHYLRVTLDKSENFKVAVGKKLNELLELHFSGNRNRLRDWYEAEVVEGKAHRAWTTVERFLSVVRQHGEAAESAFAKARERDAEWHREKWREKKTKEISRDIVQQVDTVDNDTNVRLSEYDKRLNWLSSINYLWFKADPEWQDKWLEDRNLFKGPGGLR